MFYDNLICLLEIPAFHRNVMLLKNGTLLASPKIYAHFEEIAPLMADYFDLIALNGMNHLQF